MFFSSALPSNFLLHVSSLWPPPSRVLLPPADVIPVCFLPLDPCPSYSLTSLRSRRPLVGGRPLFSSLSLKLLAFLFHWLLLASCLWLPPRPSLSLTRTALPPFLVHSSSHSLSWLFLAPSLSLYLQELIVPQSVKGDVVGGLIQCWCCISMYVPSFGTDLITPVLPQYATITPRILQQDARGRQTPPLVLYGAA